MLKQAFYGFLMLGSLNLLAQTPFNPTEFALRFDISDPYEYVNAAYDQLDEKVELVRSLHKQANRNELLDGIEWREKNFKVKFQDHPELVELSRVIDFFISEFNASVQNKMHRGIQYSFTEKKLLNRGLPKADLDSLYQFLNEDNDPLMWSDRIFQDRFNAMTGSRKFDKQFIEAIQHGEKPDWEEFKRLMALSRTHKRPIKKELCVFFLSELSERGRIVVLSYAFESQKSSLKAVHLYQEIDMDKAIQEIQRKMNIRKENSND